MSAALKPLNPLEGWTLYGAAGMKAIPRDLWWVFKYIPPTTFRGLPTNTFLAIGPKHQAAIVRVNMLTSGPLTDVTIVGISEGRKPKP